MTMYIRFVSTMYILLLSELTCRTTNTSRDITGLQMNTKKMQEPKFDSNLLLAKSVRSTTSTKHVRR